MDSFIAHPFWIPLLEIIGVDILLSGDNAVVIALAVRSLPPHQQRRAIIFGSMAAVAMRVILTIFVVELLRLPYLKLIGSTLLLWIGIKLQLPGGDGGPDIESKDTMFAAIKTILIADMVMSLDNVIGIAAAAKGHVGLLMIGLAISIPLIVFGSSVMLRLMQRFPFIVVLGGALLGYISGEMAVSDSIIHPWLETNAGWAIHLSGFGCALGVVVVGRWLVQRKTDPGKDRVL